MKKISIIICNFNKKEYVEKNVESLMRQTIRNFDIYVVDNASTDGSVDYLSNLYGGEITIICNTENLGGSGGFNSGIKVAMEAGYEYIMLLDNDVVLAEDCVEHLLKTMEEKTDIGMMGCEILKMDYPDIIQEFGPTLDYERMNFICNHGGEVDKGQLPEIEDCDYVPACAMIIRKEVVEKIGLMPQENFIYYDDITWGVMCHRAGYRVVACSLAKAWHKGGAAVNPSTFPTYYLTRNKVKFFTTYMCTSENVVTDAQVSKRADKILQEVFEGIYSCSNKGMMNVAKTRAEAFVDAIQGKTGKAEAYHIREREAPEEKFNVFLLEKKRIRLHMNGLWEPTRRIIFWINELQKKMNCNIEIHVVDKDKYVGKEILEYQINEDANVVVDNGILDVYICNHIYEIKIEQFDKLWIDGWRNVVFDEEDFKSQKEYERAYELYKLCYKDMVCECIKTNNRDLRI